MRPLPQRLFFRRHFRAHIRHTYVQRVIQVLPDQQNPYPPQTKRFLVDEQYKTLVPHTTLPLHLQCSAAACEPGVSTG
jgi:hypothetical protein